MDSHELGLELTNNSKTGWAFSLSRKDSCIHATDLCKKLCYGNGIRYQSDAQKVKRERNFKTVEFLLDKGGPELLAQNLCALVDQARPSDWLVAQINSAATSLPWTLRIHDVGDAHSVRYTQAWTITVSQRPNCRFWFYTRSFSDEQLLSALSELAALPNCNGLLSIDSENFEQGLLAYAQYPGIWKLALLQQDEAQLHPDLMPAVKASVNPGQIVSFTFHRGPHHVKPVIAEPLTVCPQIASNAFPLQHNRHLPKPCQSCQICLPV